MMGPALAQADSLLVHAAPLPDVRPEYRAFALKFLNLMKLLDEPISEAEHRRLCTLTDAVEVIDRHYDAHVDIKDRTALRSSLFHVLRGGEDSQLPMELKPLVKELRSFLGDEALRERFISAVEEIFSTSEILRSTDNVKEAVDLSLREGEATAELVFLILEEKTAYFRELILKITGAAKLWDDIMDSESDRAKGERVYPNSEDFYRVARPRLLKETWEVFLQAPQKLRLKILSKASHWLLQTLKRKLKQLRGSYM